MSLRAWPALLAAAAGLAAAAPPPAVRLDDATIAADLQTVQRMVLEGVPASGAAATLRLRLVVPKSVDTQRVGALMLGNEAVVQVPAGFYIRALEMSKALALLPGNAWAERWLLPYLHYLSLAELFERPLLGFADYVELARGSREPALREGPELDANTSGMLLASLAFVVGHELAHHLLGHTQPGGTPPGPAQEAAADAEAVRYCIGAGVNPAPAVMTFLLLARAQDWFTPVSPYSTHPAPLLRGVRLARAAAQQVRQSSGRSRERLSVQGRFDIETLAAAVDRMGDMLARLEQEQRRLSGADKAALLAEAEAGRVQALLKVAHLYATGERPEFPYEPARAATWAGFAARAATRASLVDYAHAHYAAAWFRSFHESAPRDDALACRHAQVSADTGYRPGLHLLGRLRADGRCG